MRAAGGGWEGKGCGACARCCRRSLTLALTPALAPALALALVSPSPSRSRSPSPVQAALFTARYAEALEKLRKKSFNGSDKVSV